MRTAPLSRVLGPVIAALGVLIIVPGCTPKKKVYTIPSVTKEIEGSIHKARALKAQGKLKAASIKVLQVSKAVLKEYPQATLTQEPVKKLLGVIEWIANLCLDRSLELKNEAVSAAEDDLSKTFRQWSDKHRENLSAIRAMVPNLKKAAVAARRPPPRAGAKARPRPAMGTEPAGGQPKPDEPRIPAGGDGMEPG